MAVTKRHDKLNYEILFLLVLFFCLCIYIGRNIFKVLALPHSHHPLWRSAYDSWYGLIFARQWLTGGGFHDRMMYFTNAPFNGVKTHLTAPTNLLLAPFFYNTPPWLPINTRLMISAAIVPPLLGLLSFLTLLWGSKKASPSCKGSLFLLLALFFLPDVILLHFQAGFADHHPLQIFLWCLTIIFYVQRPNLKNSLILGFVLALSLWVSVEALIFFTALCALLGTAAIIKPSYIKSLVAFCASTAFFSTVALAIEVPIKNFFSHVTYNSISIVQITFLVFATIISIVAMPVFHNSTSWKSRAAAAAAAGIALALSMHAVFPLFFQGPFVGDPYINREILNIVAETQPLFKSSLSVILVISAQPLLAAAVLYMRLRRRKLLWQDASMAFLLALTSAMMFVMIRWYQYALPIAAYILLTRLPPLVRLYGRKNALLRKLGPLQGSLGILYITILLAYAPVISLSGHHAPSSIALCRDTTAQLIETGKLQTLLGKKPLILYIEPGFSGLAGFLTPYRVIAGYRDKETIGLHDMTGIAKAGSPQAALPLLKKRQVDALLICPAEYKKGSWFKKIAAEKDTLPDWLRMIPLPKAGSPQDGPVLLRVRKSD